MVGDTCSLDHPMSRKPKVGRPLLVKGKESMRVGFVITKEQWLMLTERARQEGCSFSDIVRRALDLFAALSILLALGGCGAEPQANPAAAEAPTVSKEAPTATETVTETPEAVGAEHPAIYIADASRLPICDPEAEGWLYYVSSESTFKVCEGSQWTDIDLKGETGETGADGKDGAQGLPGAKGVSVPALVNTWLDPISGSTWLMLGGTTSPGTCGSDWRLGAEDELSLAAVHGLWAGMSAQLGSALPSIYDCGWNTGSSGPTIVKPGATCPYSATATRGNFCIHL